MDTLMIVCPACGATNRVPGDKVAQGLAPVCGKCKYPTARRHAAAGHRRELRPGRRALAAAGAAGRVGPVVWSVSHARADRDQLAAELAGRVRVVKLNVDDNPRTAARFDLRSIPTLLVLKGGREVDRLVGVRPKQEIMGRLEKAIA